MAERLRISCQYMMELGIIGPSSRGWSSPLHMEPKKTPGDWGSCGKYEHSTIEPCQIIIPSHIFRITHLLYMASTSLQRSTLLSLSSNTSWTNTNIPKTAIMTPFGLFEFLNIAFGLRSETQTIQWFIGQVQCGLHLCYAYADDLLIASSATKRNTNTI